MINKSNFMEINHVVVFLLELSMDNALKKQRQRVRNIKEATEVNKKLIAAQDRRSERCRK